MIINKKIAYLAISGILLSSLPAFADHRDRSRYVSSNNVPDQSDSRISKPDDNKYSYPTNDQNYRNRGNTPSCVNTAAESGAGNRSFAFPSPR
jgi:hypothetical protein